MKWTPLPPPPPTLRIGDRTVTEGNTGTASGTFTVTLSAPSTQPVTVAYTTGNGSATAGSDYQAASGTLTFAPGETTKTIAVPVIGDRLVELNETFVVNLSSPTNATIADGQGVGTIVDDEPRISISDVTKTEGKKGQTTLFTFTVTLSTAYDQPVTMSFKTTDGTATTSDNNYVAKTGTLTFSPGETTKTITIEVKGDNKKEANEPRHRHDLERRLIWPHQSTPSGSRSPPAGWGWFGYVLRSDTPLDRPAVDVTEAVWAK